MAMVVNHAGYALLTPGAANEALTGALVFLGGLAPAMFFWATGAGVGLRSPGRGTQWRKALMQAGWLVLGDQFLLWSSGRHVGLDFLAFIGISILVVEAVAASARPILKAGLLVAGLLLLRFATRPWLDPLAVDNPTLAWITGLRAVSGVSYPLTPWMVLPVVGWMMMRSLKLTNAPRHSGLAILLLSGAAASGCVAIQIYSHNFHRWATVNAAYVGFASVSLIFLWHLASLFFFRLPRLASALSMRGPYVFMVVPVHYSMLAGLQIWADHRLSGLFGATIVLATAVLALTISRRATPKWIALWHQIGRPVSLAVIALSGAFALLAPISGPIGTVVCMLGVALVCVQLSPSLPPARTDPTDD